MRIISSVLVFVLTIYAVPWAQTQSLSAKNPSLDLCLAAGTRLRVKLDSTLSTNVARPSDTVEAIVTKASIETGLSYCPREPGFTVRSRLSAVPIETTRLSRA